MSNFRIIPLLMLFVFLSICGNVAADDGMTPLHKIASGKTLKGAASLIKKGADIEAKDVKGSTPLIVASEYGNEAMIKYLLESGANLEAANANGWRALHMAAYCGEINSMALLIKEGAEIESKSKKGATALHAATVAGKADAVNVLLKSGAKVEALSILRAVILGHTDIALILFQNADTKVIFAIILIPVTIFLLLMWKVYLWMFVRRE